MEIEINGQRVQIKGDGDTPLLWILRDDLDLTGTKYGCGMARCGACTVLVDGQAIRSCVTPVSDLVGKKVTTIEGLSPDGSHPVQQAWIQENVPPMRILPKWTNYVGRGPSSSQTHRRRHRFRHVWKSVSLRNLPAH